VNRVIKIHGVAKCIHITKNTSWMNPFRVGHDGSQYKVMGMFRQYAEWRLSIQPDWLDPLKGKDLYCNCEEVLCHGDVIIELLNRRG